MIALKIFWGCEGAIFQQLLADIADFGHSVTLWGECWNENDINEDTFFHIAREPNDIDTYDLIILGANSPLVGSVSNDSILAEKCFVLQSTVEAAFKGSHNIFPRSFINIVQLSSRKIVSQLLIKEPALWDDVRELIIDFVISRSRQEKIIHNPLSQFVESRLEVEGNIFRKKFPLFYKKLFRSDFVYIVKETQIVTVPLAMTSVTEVETRKFLKMEGGAQLALPSQRVERGGSDIIFAESFINIEIAQNKVFLELYTSKESIYIRFIDWLREFLETGNLLNFKEKEKLIDVQKQNKSLYNSSSIPKAFSDVVKKSGKSTAIMFGGESISYEELFQRAKCLADTINTYSGCLKEKPVAIYMHKSIDLITAMLSVLMNGAYYVPIDPTYPEERINNILKESNPKLIVCSEDLEKTITINEDMGVFILSDKSVLMSSNSDFKDQSTSNDNAYVVFTSGSTGKPKGVVITQKNVLALVNGAQRACNIKDTDRILSITSVGFDAFGWDVYSALLTGATLVLSQERAQLEPEALSNLIEHRKITFATFTPSVLSLLEVPIETSIRILIVMGDKPSRELMEKWSKITKVMNGYGPTETTIAASLGFYSSEISAQCIGYPISNYRFYVLDESLSLVPKGVIGELCIGGEGVGLGYFHADKLTKERFISLPLSGAYPKERLYCTGDMVFQNPDDSFEFIGRNDYQVKIRGVRIEPQEVENILCQYPGVKEAIVIVSGEADKFLTAYIALSAEVDEDALKKYVALNVHPAAFPRYLIFVDNFELTRHGKIDKNKLPPITVENEGGLKLEPINDLEYSILKIFQTVLKTNNIGTQENFFLIGGHSLMAAKVIGEIAKKFSIRLSYKDFFESASVHKVAHLLSSLEKSKNSAIIKQEERVGPLTFQQERLWYLYQLDPEDRSYNLPLAYKFKRGVDKEKLERALKRVFSKHETFRTIFKQTPQGPLQHVAGSIPKVHYLSVQPEELDMKLTNLCKEPFDLEKSPPVRVCLISSGSELLLFFVKHNIITDAWSEGIIIRDIIDNYNNDGDLSLSHEHDSVDFSQSLDVAFYQKNRINKDSLKKELNYWTSKLKDHVTLDFPTHPRPSILRSKGRRSYYKFNKKGWEHLKLLAKKHETTPFVVLITLFKIMLSKYSDQNDILVGTAHSGREHGINDQTTGFFVNTIPLRTVLDPNKDFLYNLDNVTKTCIDAFSHQNVPFEWIVEHVKAERFLNKNPLFQIMVVWQNADETDLPRLTPDIKVDLYKVDPCSSMFDMVWNFKEENGLSVELDYNIELFRQGEVESFCAALDNMLAEITTKSSDAISSLRPYSTKSEIEIIKLASGTNKVFQEEDSVLSRIESVTSKLGSRAAVSCGNKELTYNDLIKDAEKVCAFIQSKTKGLSRCRVGVSLQRSERVVISILGIIMAGGSYVPLDPSYPLDRLNFISKDASLDMVITDSVDEVSLGVTYKDTIDHAYKKSPVSIKHEDVAYIMYTSGTTGAPKGVIISQGNLLNVLDDFVQRLGLNSKTVWYSLTTINFDIFALELFAPLMCGGTVIMSEQEVYRNPVKIVNEVNEKKPNVLQATPTMWSAICDHVSVPKLKVLCGGEPMHPSLLAKLQKVSKKVFNVYGPTETTIWSTAQDVSEETEISIGRPLQNTQCFVLDSRKMLCPMNAVGDLYIGGEGVSYGYMNRQELTSEVFCSVHLGEEERRLYKTGDRALLRSDGKFYCFGRSDNQVKLRGNRIELEEIESVINSHPDVLMSACRLWGEGVNAYIAAYVTWTPEREFNLDEIKKIIFKELPSVMHPTYIEKIDNIPKTENGKLDRKKLQEPKSLRLSTLDQGYVAPSGELEIDIQNVWQNVIGVSRISVLDNFFMVGGNSLHIPLIIMRLQEKLELELTIREFILNSTIRELSVFLLSRLQLSSDFQEK